MEVGDEERCLRSRSESESESKSGFDWRGPGAGAGVGAGRGIVGGERGFGVGGGRGSGSGWNAMRAHAMHRWRSMSAHEVRGSEGPLQSSQREGSRGSSALVGMREEARTGTGTGTGLRLRVIGRVGMSGSWVMSGETGRRLAPALRVVGAEFVGWWGADGEGEGEAGIFDDGRRPGVGRAAGLGVELDGSFGTGGSEGERMKSLQNVACVSNEARRLLLRPAAGSSVICTLCLSTVYKGFVSFVNGIFKTPVGSRGARRTPWSASAGFLEREPARAGLTFADGPCWSLRTVTFGCWKLTGAGLSRIV